MKIIIAAEIGYVLRFYTTIFQNNLCVELWDFGGKCLWFLYFSVYYKLLPILEDTIVLSNHFGYRINIGMKVIGQYTYAHQMSIMYFYVNCNQKHSG